MEGTEITREALEGMGFKRGLGEIYRYEVENRLPIEVYKGQNTTVIQYGEPGWEVVHEVHVKTLPELRKFMRFMFGIKEFPRRELSTITDEEAVTLCRILNTGTMELHNNFPFLSVYKTDYLKVCKEQKLGDRHSTLVYFSLSEGNFCDYYDYDSKNNIAGYNYLTNVCDFHLPAFHEAAHNAN